MVSDSSPHFVTVHCVLIDLRELPKNNLCILLALLPVFYVVTTCT